MYDMRGAALFQVWLCCLQPTSVGQHRACFTAARSHNSSSKLLRGKL